jgi:hypothetical protein
MPIEPDTIEVIKHFLLWNTVINYVILLIWAGAILVARNWIFAMHGRMFGVAPEKIAAMHFKCIAIYKIGILLFNLVPLAALYFAA